MSVVETLAVLVILFSSIKISVLLVNPDGWFELSSRLYGGGWITQVLFLLLAGGVLFGLLGTLSVVDVLACSAFVGLIQGVALAAHPGMTRDLLDRYRRSRRRLRSAWPVALAWMVLCVWGALVLIF